MGSVSRRAPTLFVYPNLAVTARNAAESVRAQRDARESCCYFLSITFPGAGGRRDLVSADLTSARLLSSALPAICGGLAFYSVPRLWTRRDQIGAVYGSVQTGWTRRPRLIRLSGKTMQMWNNTEHDIDSAISIARLWDRSDGACWKERKAAGISIVVST